jgi:hypothetical protein
MMGFSEHSIMDMEKLRTNSNHFLVTSLSSLFLTNSPLAFKKLCNSLGGKVNIDYYALFGGRGSHEIKFDAAIKASKKQDIECLILKKASLTRFVKLTPKLIEFGIIGNNLKYSDPEKTILDFIYIWRYNGVPKEKIVLDVSEWAKDISREKTKKICSQLSKNRSGNR